MTFEDMMKVAAAGASAPVTALIIKFFSDRKAARESTRQREVDGSSSATVAAIGAFKDMLAAQQNLSAALAEENKQLRIENRTLRERHETLARVVNNIALLLIEDDTGVVKVIKRYLEGSEFTVTAVGKWSEAELLLTSSPDIAIVDLCLPDSIPEETVGRVTEYKGQHPSVPIGIITGTNFIEDIIAPQGVKVAHKNDVMTSPERFKTFLYSVLNY